MAITNNSIRPQAGQVCRALITVGDDAGGRWYSRRGTESFGSATGDLVINSTLTIDRIWSPESNEDDDFRINVDGTGSFAEWVWGAANLNAQGRVNSGDAVSAPFGAGYSKSVYLAFVDTGDNEIIYELPFTTFRNTGGGWYNLEVSNAQDTQLDGLVENDLVNFVIADSGGSTEINSIPDFGSATIADQTYTRDAEIPTLQLPEATGGNGALTYSTTDLQLGLLFDPATRQITGTPIVSGDLDIVYTVTDTDSDTDTLTFNINVTQPDLMPSFGGATIPDQTYPQNVQITPLQLPQATGGDGTLTYWVTALPSGLSFSPSLRQIIGTPDTVGTSTVTYHVVDEDNDMDTIDFDITINAPDLMPTFGSAIIADQTYVQNDAITALQLPVATGGDGTLVYSLSTLPSGLQFNAGNRQITGTPDTVGTTNMVYTVTDDDSDTDTLNFSITVNAPDLMPTFGTATVADQTYTQNQAITPLQLPAATGGDGTLIYSAFPLPSGLDFSIITRRITGTPGLTGTTTVTYTVTDEDNDTDTLTFDITVNAAPVTPGGGGSSVGGGKKLRITLDNGMTLDLEEGKDFEIRDPIISSVKQRAVNAVAHIYFNQNSTLHDWLVQNRVGARVELIY